MKRMIFLLGMICFSVGVKAQIYSPVAWSYAANRAVNECDVLFSIRTRFNDRVTGKISEFAPNAKIIHIA